MLSQENLEHPEITSGTFLDQKLSSYESSLERLGESDILEIIEV